MHKVSINKLFTCQEWGAGSCLSVLHKYTIKSIKSIIIEWTNWLWWRGGEEEVGAHNLDSVYNIVRGD